MIFGALFWLFGLASAFATDLAFEFSPTIEKGANPWLSLSSPRDTRTMQIAVVTPVKTYNFTKTNVGAGQSVRIEWPRNSAVTEATVKILVEYTDSFEEEIEIPLTWNYGVPLSVDLSKAHADVSTRTLSVRVNTPVDKAEIVAYGAHKAVIEQQEIALHAGPGEIDIPWIGSPSEVVLLDVTLHAGTAYAGFTYSPWFLDIPHEDVLFDSNSSVINASEEPKLQATLVQLHDVLDKYGEIVPVKLYIAGCTDTVGESQHNRDLSRDRAKAIATWLRKNGYSKPIFYYGFGESWLAEATGDGVDSPLNRRAQYMVGANPPPGGSGVPAVSWIPL